MIISKTPYRLSFFGGGTDYNSWFEENESIVLAAAIDYYCYISIRKLPPFFDHKHRIVYSKIENVQNISEIDHPSVRECLNFMKMQDGYEIHYDGDLPSRSGLGSSSSFTVGFLNALHSFNNKIIDKKALSEKAIYVEQKLIGESVGVQDQIMASYGGIQKIHLNKSINVSNLKISKEFKQTLESSILLGFSGVSRFSGIHATGQIKNIKSGKSERDLKAINEIAKYGLDCFEKEASIQHIGKLLDESWQHKKQLSDGLSPKWMEELYDTAIRHGAFGGKLMGAGGGGFFYFIAPNNKHQKIKEALNGIKVWVPFKFAKDGSKIISI